MPNYKDAKYLKENTSAAFDTILKPGQITPNSGIYRCDACGFEASSTEGHPLPPAESCSHHGGRWKCSVGQVRWRLVAAAIHTTT
jgi:hypothetical protein